jgi:hypothetical protein
MDNTTLEKIIQEKKIEELKRLNSVTMIENLFAKLMDREKDVLSRRYALGGGPNETLEKIGGLHNLTRERVRQIEAASIKKIRKYSDLDESLNTLKAVIVHLLEEHGGLLRKDFLLDILSVMTTELSGEADLGEKKDVYKNNFDFIISKILADEFDFMTKSDRFNPAIKMKEEKIDHFEELADDLMAKIDILKQTLTTEELVDLLKKLDAYNRYQDKLNREKSMDISPLYKSQTFYDKGELINNNKMLYSLIQAIKNLERNKFGHWGKADWQEISPKTINDKIYLILKHHGSPLHFTEIANKINEANFDHKKANAATVHNELILDDRYILTSRGTYGLKVWRQ